MGSAFFARNLITETLVQAVNEDTSATSLSRLKKAVEKHRYDTPLLFKTQLMHSLPREESTIQYRLMANAAIKTMSEFPDIREDFVRVDNGVEAASKDIAFKLKQVRYQLPSQCMRIYARY